MLYKPRRIYFLPIFSGSNGHGHCFFMVINKRKAYCQGWIIDSLGMANTKNSTTVTIKKMISNTRMKKSIVQGITISSVTVRRYLAT